MCNLPPFEFLAYIAWLDPLFRIFVLYLCVIIAVTLVSARGLAERLNGPPNRKRFPWNESTDDDHQAAMLAGCALSGQLNLESLGAMASENPERANRIIDNAGRRIAFASEMYTIRLTAMKRRLIPTLFLTGAMFGIAAYKAIGFVICSKGSPGAALTAGILNFMPLVGFALFTFAVIYGLAGFFQGVLARRQAACKYFASASLVARDGGF